MGEPTTSTSIPPTALALRGRQVDGERCASDAPDIAAGTAVIGEATKRMRSAAVITARGAGRNDQDGMKRSSSQVPAELELSIV